MELWCDIFCFLCGTSLVSVRVAVQNIFRRAGESPMGNVDEYRRSAASLLDLAQRTDSVANKDRFLAMAAAWRDLADRATKLTEGRARNAPDHPLIRATLGSAEAE
jgi:hypothetical protein